MCIYCLAELERHHKFLHIFSLSGTPFYQISFAGMFWILTHIVHCKKWTTLQMQENVQRLDSLKEAGEEKPAKEWVWIHEFLLLYFYSNESGVHCL